MFGCKTFPLLLMFPLAAVAVWQSLCRLGNICCKCLPSLCGHLTLHHPSELWKFCHPHYGGRDWSREDLDYLFPGILEILGGGICTQISVSQAGNWSWCYFLKPNQYFGDTQTVFSTADGFYSKIIIFVSCFRSFFSQSSGEDTSRNRMIKGVKCLH